MSSTKHGFKEILTGKALYLWQFQDKLGKIQVNHILLHGLSGSLIFNKT